MSILENQNKINSDVLYLQNKIKTNLQEKGITDLTNETINELADKILDISGSSAIGPSTPIVDDWTRPADRPEKPEITDNTFLMLFGVGEESPNDIAFLCKTSTGQYHVDWGDGTSDNYNSNVKAEHLYDYESIYVDPDSLGYKMVWIKVTSLDGNIITIDLQQRHSQRPASTSIRFICQVFEMYIHCAWLNSLNFSTMPNTTLVDYKKLEIFCLGHNQMSQCYYLLSGCHNLRIIEQLENDNILTVGFMGYCYNYNRPFPSGVTFNNVTTDFMSGCYNYNQPFPSGVTFEKATTNFMYNCRSYNQPFPSGVTFKNVKEYFMYSCTAYNQPFPSGVTFSSATASFMYACYNYNQPFPSGVTFSNVTANFMRSCYSYNQPFPSGVTFEKATDYFMDNCNSYNQLFPSGVTFSNVTIKFMGYCNSYNQPFPSGITFEKATNGFMYACSSYNQPFPSEVTFENITYEFMVGCSNNSYSISVIMQNISPVGTSFIGSSNYSLKGLRLQNMGIIHDALTISNSSLDRLALIALFGDLADRTSTTIGTINVTNCFGANKLTAEDRLIATQKNWKIVG